MHAGPWKPNKPERPEKKKGLTAEELAVVLLGFFMWGAFMYSFIRLGGRS